jgi:hypothetical protein
MVRVDFSVDFDTSDFLHSLSLSAATLRKYSDAAHEFYVWVSEMEYEVVSVTDLDLALDSYIHHLCRVGLGSGRQKAVNTLCGVAFALKHLHPPLARSRQALKGWKRFKPSKSYPPMTWSTATVVARYLVFVLRKPLLGLGVLLAFDCMLRVSELCSLRVCDIADASDPRLSLPVPGVVLSLGKTKTGDNKSVVIYNSRLAALVAATAEDHGASFGQKHRLFGATPAIFRYWFKKACTGLGLSPSYTPHSLRHGGATHYHSMGKAIDWVRERGRWAHTASACHYIQSGRSLLLSLSVPPEVAVCGKLLVEDLDLVFGAD